MVVKTLCPICRKMLSVEVPEKGYLAWRRGELLIQDAMPELTEAERELLLSGICADCWDKVLGEELED